MIPKPQGVRKGKDSTTYQGMESGKTLQLPACKEVGRAADALEPAQLTIRYFFAGLRLSEVKAAFKYPFCLNGTLFSHLRGNQL